MYVFDVVDVPEYFRKEGFAVVEMFDMPGLYAIAHIETQTLVVDCIGSVQTATTLLNEMVRLAHVHTTEYNSDSRIKGILEGRFGNKPWELFGTSLDCRRQWLLAVKMAGGTPWF